VSCGCPATFATFAVIFAISHLFQRVHMFLQQTTTVLFGHDMSVLDCKLSSLRISSKKKEEKERLLWELLGRTKGSQGGRIVSLY